MYLYVCSGKVGKRACASAFQDSRAPLKVKSCEAANCTNRGQPLQLAQRRVDYPVNKAFDVDMTNCSILSPESMSNLSRVTNTRNAIRAAFERVKSETGGMIAGEEAFTITRPAPVKARYYMDWVADAVEWKARYRGKFGTKFAIVEYEACVNIDQAHELKKGEVGAPDTPHVGWDVSIRVISFRGGGAFDSENQETRVGHILVDWVPYHRDLDPTYQPNYDAVPWAGTVPLELQGAWKNYLLKKEEDRAKPRD